MRPDNWLSDLRALMADKIEWPDMLNPSVRERIHTYLVAEGRLTALCTTTL